MFSADKAGSLHEIFTAMRRKKKDMQELVELLEDKAVFKRYADEKQYQQFSEAYTIELIKKYVRSPDEREIMFSTYQLLADDNAPKGIKNRRIYYATQAVGINERIQATWSKPSDSLYVIEEEIIEDIIERIVKTTTDNGKKEGWLNLAKPVVAKLKKTYPNGLPKKLPLPLPSYKAQKDDTPSIIKKRPDKATIEPPPPPSPPLAPGWGDDGGCRPSYTVAQVNGGILGDRIVFNSISDGVIGNEKNFVGIREDDGAYNGQENHWKCDYITVEDGKVYILRLYIHNDNPDHKEAIAKEVMAAFSLSPGSAKEHLISGNIRSSNAQPKHYWASIVLRSNTAPFHIEYVWGSADLEGNYVNGSPRMHRLSDRIVTKASAGGVLIDADYDTRDGRIPGSFAYACYVGIRIRVVFDKVEENTDYTFSQKVRLDDSKKWEDYSITTKIGDIVEFQMAYANKSTVGLWHENVTVQTLLPEGLEYIPGSTVLYNSKYKAGKSLTEDDILTPRALCIGAYKPKANAFVRFKAKVVGRKSLPILINRAQCCVGNSSLVDDVEIVVLY